MNCPNKRNKNIFTSVLASKIKYKAKPRAIAPTSKITSAIFL
jgi:hypothetical protein